MERRSLFTTFGRSAARALSLIGTLALLITALTVTPRAAAANAGVLRITAPAQVELGVPIDVVLTIENATDIAGYEVALRYDPAAAHFGGVLQHNSQPNRNRVIEPLGVVELDDGVVFGHYSCQASTCTEAPTTRRQAVGASGTTQLATVTVVADQEGTLELAFDALKFVDSAGNPVTVTLPNMMLTVQVGSASGAARYTVPTRAAVPSGPLAASSTPAQADLTDDGIVNHADVMDLLLAWQRSRENGAVCGAGFDARFDLNADGCLDVTDAQRVASSYSDRGQITNAATPQASLTFTVNSTGDEPDAARDGQCATASGTCTLRAAITAANQNNGADTIAFNIAGSGVKTIQVNTALPSINDTSGPTTIDGYTQPGAYPNNDPLVSNAIIKIEVRGNGPTSTSRPTADGLYITSAGNTIRGLAVLRHNRQILMLGAGATDNVIVGNFVGTNATGTYSETYRIDKAIGGIAHHLGAARNRIGGFSPAERNVISGNAADGISYKDDNTNDNMIYNNIIGLSPNGKNRLRNRIHGVDIDTHASRTKVGGLEPGQRNVISGNVRSGVEISHGSGTINNRVVGNFVGTDVTGSFVIPNVTPNEYIGIRMEDAPRFSVISDNIVGGNKSGGIQAVSPVTSENRIEKNRVGISINGQPIPNGVYGVRITYHAQKTKVGPGNIIANNPVGIEILGDVDNDFNTITQNSIYNNGEMGIDIYPMGKVNPNDGSSDRDSGANDQLNYPVMTSATPSEVRGTACVGCIVEVFVSDRDATKYGPGKTFVGSATAGADRKFTVPVTGVVVGNHLTTTATDTLGNTSEFSHNMLVTQSAPAPSAGNAPAVDQHHVYITIVTN